jgi:SAM-dependent methyltransferase
VNSERERCLREFESYYGAHFEVLTQYAQQGSESWGELFRADALRRLYDDYCKDSVARLYDNLQKVKPALNGRQEASRPLAILDITCFATTQIFRIAFPGAAVHACDKHLKWAAFLDGVECQTCDLETDRLPYEDAAFDLVVFTETLEHIPRSPYAILGEIKRVLKSGGVLLFSVPNLSSLNNRIRLLLGKNILSVERFHSEAFGHFREFNLSEVTYMFRQIGMEVITAEYASYAAPRARGSGLRAARTLVSGLVHGIMSAAVPSLRPVCLAVVRKPREVGSQRGEI